MATIARFDELTQVFQGQSGETNTKLTDVVPIQHVHVATGDENSINGTRRICVADTMCKPYIIASKIDSSGVYTASCQNFPNLAIATTDEEGNSHVFLGLTVKIRFDAACNYGDGSTTYPTINVDSLGAMPITCQGKLAASGFCSAGQQLEATLSKVSINGTETLTWDIDTNVRGYASGVITNADGSTVYDKDSVDARKAVTSLTTAEYDALPEATKNDGTVYNLTDSDSGFVTTVSSVISGNTNAVTSGGVYSYVNSALGDLGKLQTASYTTSVGTIGIENFIQIGKFVCIVLHISTTVTTSANNVFVSGLPKAVTNDANLVYMKNHNTGDIYKGYVNINGALVTTDTVPSGCDLRFSFCYLCQ